MAGSSPGLSDQRTVLTLAPMTMATQPSTGVVAGLDPAIHASDTRRSCPRETWILGSSSGSRPGTAPRTITRGPGMTIESSSLTRPTTSAEPDSLGPDPAIYVTNSATAAPGRDLDGPGMTIESSSLTRPTTSAEPHSLGPDPAIYVTNSATAAPGRDLDAQFVLGPRIAVRGTGPSLEPEDDPRARAVRFSLGVASCSCRIDGGVRQARFGLETLTEC
jgi:hypothetical protein